MQQKETQQVGLDKRRRKILSKYQKDESLEEHLEGSFKSRRAEQASSPSRTSRRSA